LKVLVTKKKTAGFTKDIWKDERTVGAFPLEGNNAERLIIRLWCDPIFLVEEKIRIGNGWIFPFS